MVFLLWMAVLLILQRCHSYILLTANLDDVKALAKQMYQSPVAGQINTIIRRASSLFNQQLRAADPASGQPRYARTNPDLDSSLEQPQEKLRGKRNQGNPPRHHHYSRRQANGQAEEAENKGMEAKSGEISNRAEDEREIIEPDDRRSENHAKEGESPNETLEVSTHKITKKSLEVLNGEPKEKTKLKDGPSQTEIDEMNRLSSKYIERRSQTDEVIQLGKNASLYLDSIKKIMENA